MIERLGSGGGLMHVSDAWILLVETAVKVSLVLLCAAVVSGALRRCAARVRRRVWSTALCGVLLLPVLSEVLPSFSVPFLPMSRFASGGTDAGGADRLIGVTGMGSAAPGLAPLSNVGRDTATTRPPRTRGWAPVAVWIWAFGAMGVAVWFLVGLRRVSRLRACGLPVTDDDWCVLTARLRVRLGVTRRVDVMLSEDVSSPVAFGLARPVILLPTDARSWSSERRSLVLRHELVHVKRRDWAVQVIGQIVCTLHWFNPLAWMAARRFVIERELACDEDVIATGAKPSEYASHLLDIARSMTSRTLAPLAALTMASRSHLEDRLRSILAGAGRRDRAPLAWGCTCVMVAAVPALAMIYPWGGAPVPPSATSRLAAASALMHQSRWSDAANALSGITRDAPHNGPAWLRLALALKELGRWDLAIDAAARASEIPETRAAAFYEMGRTRALQGETERAFGVLEEARRAGFHERKEVVLRDADLARLKSRRRLGAWADRLVPPRVQFETFDRARDRARVVLLWKTYPQEAIHVIHQDLEDSLRLREERGSDSAARIEALQARALRAAEAADEAFGRPTFSEYARSVIGWDQRQRAQRRRVRDILEAVTRAGAGGDGLNTLGRLQYAASALRGLGDAIGLVDTLLRLGAELEKAAGPKELQAALNALEEAGSLARRLGMPREELAAMRARVSVFDRMGHLQDRDALQKQIDELVNLISPPRDAPRPPGSDDVTASTSRASAPARRAHRDSGISVY